MDRVLDVRQGDLCWVAGTIYMDMPLKPNILDDISKDVGDLYPVILIPQADCSPDPIAVDICTTAAGKIYIVQWPGFNYA